MEHAQSDATSGTVFYPSCLAAADIVQGKRPADEACLSGDPSCRFDMDGMKCFPSVLDVKTNRIYDSVSASHRISDGSLVMNIGFDGLKLRIIDSE